MTRGEGGLLFEIDAAVQGGDRPGWQPEAMFGRSLGQYGDFASDALGAVIARGLITLMGGSIELRRPVPGRASLFVSVPLRLVDAPTAAARVEAESITVQTVLTALLRRVGWSVWQPGAANQKVAAVLLEAGGADETVRAARLRAEHPAARLVAVGEPAVPGIFDAVCPQPVTVDALSDALRADAASRREVS